MDWNIKQGSKLKTLRMRKGFDQAYVANKLNVNITSISNWETGKNKPKPKHLHDLAFLYNVPIEEITEADVISVSPESAELAKTLSRANPVLLPYLEPIKPQKSKYADLVAFMSMVSDRSEQEIIDSAIECYARSFPWQTLVEQHFLGDNKES